MTTTTLADSGRRVFQSSELSRSGAGVFAAAEQAPVEVTRRDGRNLVLMSSDENDARDRLLAIAAQLIAATLDEDRGSLAERLAERFDWMLALPADEQDACARDIIRAARASFSTRQAHLAVAEVAAWKSTAEAYAAGLSNGPIDWLDEPVSVERPV